MLPKTAGELGSSGLRLPFNEVRGRGHWQGLGAHSTEARAHQTPLLVVCTVCVCTWYYVMRRDGPARAPRVGAGIGSTSKLCGPGETGARAVESLVLCLALTLHRGL